jgi:uncharacterized membrane protein
VETEEGRGKDKIAPYTASRSMPDILMALAGVAIVVVVIYTVFESPLSALVFAFGVMLIYIGTWRLTGRLLHRRMNRVMRREIDNFISLSRALYTSRTNSDSARFYQTKAALRESVERIISAASTYQDDTEG